MSMKKENTSMRNSTILPLLTFLGVGLGVLIGIAAELDACTRIFWNTNPDLMIVGRNEDYVTASHPTFVATPHRGQRGAVAGAEARPRRRGGHHR
jgi:penicillin V acylase-like amidase (Ntn superfamily)